MLLDGTFDQQNGGGLIIAKSIVTFYNKPIFLFLRSDQNDKTSINTNSLYKSEFARIHKSRLKIEQAIKIGQSKRINYFRLIHVR